MPKQEDAPRDADGVLLDSVPEHIKNPSVSDADGLGDDTPRKAGPGPLGRVRRRAGAGAARAGSVIRRTASRGAGAFGAAGRSVRSAFPASTKGRAILLGGTAVVVAGAVAGGLALQAHLRDERLRVAPGGVLTLAGAPGEAWHVDLGAAVQPRIVPVGDLAAVTAGGNVLGLDPATGEELWTVEVLEPGAVADGARLRCGPSRRAVGSVAVRTATPSDPLVCVTEGVAPEVVVIGAGGDTERRTLEPGDADAEAGTAPVYAPLPDGGLAVLGRDETPVDLGDARVVENDDGVASLKGAIESAPGLTVRVEDAATGELRWGPHTVAFDPELESTSCLMWGADGPELDVLDDLTWSADERRISATACGISARLATADGEPVPDAGSQGRERVPWATDDPELDPGLVPEREGTKDVLVQTADVVVALTEEGRAEAYDADTGDRRWTADVLGEDAAAVVGSAVFGAYTDGRSAMLVVDGPSTGGEGQLRLVGLDLSTGEITWDVHQDEPYAQVASVDGRLVQMTGTGITGLLAAE
ncbi:hypothetical protein GCM10027059_03250 [Myceligenerans halotolerans]